MKPGKVINTLPGYCRAGFHGSNQMLCGLLAGMLVTYGKYQLGIDSR